MHIETMAEEWFCRMHARFVFCKEFVWSSFEVGYWRTTGRGACGRMAEAARFTQEAMWRGGSLEPADGAMRSTCIHARVRGVAECAIDRSSGAAMAVRGVASYTEWRRCGMWPRVAADDDAERLVRRLRGATGHDQRAQLRARLLALGVHALPALVDSLGDADDLARWEAVNLLGELGLDEAADAVTRFALAEREVHARWRSYWAVCRFSRERTQAALQAALAGDDADSRWSAAQILGMQGDAAGAPIFVAALDAPEPWRRWEALSAIKALALPGCESAVARCLATVHERALRQEAALALGAIGTPAARRALRSALADPEPEVRWRASMALARCDHREALPWLRECLRREADDGVRRQLGEDIANLEARHGNEKESQARGTPAAHRRGVRADRYRKAAARRAGCAEHDVAHRRRLVRRKPARRRAALR